MNLVDIIIAVVPHSTFFFKGHLQTFKYLFFCLLSYLFKICKVNTDTDIGCGFHMGGL